MEAAKSKIAAFISLLGNDARLLTGEENVTSQGLFDKINSKESAEGDEKQTKSELKYLRQILSVKENQPELFARILGLPRKARSTRDHAPELPSTASGSGNESIILKPSYFPVLHKGVANPFSILAPLSLTPSLDKVVSMVCSDGMPTMTHRTTFALDEATAQRLKRLAARWDVSQAEVVRRSVEKAESLAETLQPDTEKRLEIVRQLRASLQSRNVDTAAWMAAVQDSRR